MNSSNLPVDSQFTLLISSPFIPVPSSSGAFSITPPSHTKQQPCHLTAQLAEQGRLRQDIRVGRGVKAGL